MTAVSSEIAYSYIRFSKRDQATGDSLRRQTAAAKAWAEKNGIRLDTTVRADLGVSAFTGKHRENPDRHALAAFLKLVQDGRIARGSFLIIEGLDRLTREHVRAGLTLMLGLIEAGIRIVQLSPVEMIYDDKADAMALMLMIVELSRGNSESQRKSDMVGKAYREKKERVRKGEIMTHRLPAWIEERGGKLVLVEWKAATIRLIFSLYNSGYGLHGLVSKFTKDGVKPIGDKPRWNSVYIHMILTDRRVLGEFQLMKPDRETPDGPAIIDYFPRVVSNAEFYAARAAAAQRKTRKGANGTNINVFSGLLKHSRDGGSIYMSGRTEKGVKTPMLINTDGGDGRAACYTFQLAPFEEAILSCLKEIDPREIIGPSKAAEEVTALSGEARAVRERIAGLENELRDGEIASIARVLREREEYLGEVNRKLANAQQRAASPLAEAWGECQTILGILRSAPDPQAVRLRLRSLLRQVIDSMWCLFMRSGRMRFAVVQIYFSDSKARRDYLIVFRPKNVRFGGVTEPKLDVLSNVGFESPTDVDLRNPDHVESIEEYVLRKWKEGNLLP